MSAAVREEVAAPATVGRREPPGPPSAIRGTIGAPPPGPAAAAVAYALLVAFTVALLLRLG